MKTFNKLFAGLILGFGFLAVFGFLDQSAQASVVARAPKKTFTLSFSTTISSIAVAGSTGAWTSGQQFPGAVYEFIMSTSAAGDYCQLFDTATVVGISLTGSQTSALGPRLFAGSTSATTNIVFDPPLFYANGLVIACSAAVDQATVVYEEGRGISGQ